MTDKTLDIFAKKGFEIFVDLQSGGNILRTSKCFNTSFMNFYHVIKNAERNGLIIFKGKHSRKVIEFTQKGLEVQTYLLKIRQLAKDEKTDKF